MARGTEPGEIFYMQLEYTLTHYFFTVKNFKIIYFAQYVDSW